jgi:ABC-type glycerol-3-phosphate transport system substrate-binding protein
MNFKNKMRGTLILAAFIVSSMAIVGSTTTGMAKTNQDVTITLSVGVQTTTSLSDLITKFNGLSDYNFKVKLQESTWETNSQYDTYVANFQAQDSSIDVVSMDVIWPSDFASSGFLEQLDDVFPATEQAKFLQAPIEAGTVNGHIYGIPWFHDSAMLYYRTDVLKYAADHSIIPADRAPQTWAELHDWTIAMLDDAALKTQFNITSGFVWQGSSYEGLICDFMEYLGGTGTYSFLNADQTAPIFNTSSGVKDSLTFMKSLIDDGASPSSVLTYTEEESRAVWNAGNAIFHRNWPYAYRLGLDSVFLNGTKAGTDEKVFDVTTMPAQNASVVDPRTSCLGGWQLGVSAYSKHKTEAKEFALWLTAADQQVDYFLGNGQTPTRKALYTDSRITGSSQGYVADFLPIFDAALPRPVSALYPQMSEKIRATINSYLGGSMDLTPALDKMQGDVQGVIDANAPPTSGFEAPVAILLTVLSMATIVSIRKRKRNI